MAPTQLYRVERARPGDIHDLTGLLATLFAIESDFSIDGAKQQRGLELLLAQSQDRAVVLVARADNDKAIGMASAQLVISTAEGAPSAWVEDVVVDKAFQRRGIARLLLDGLAAWARRNGATRLQLVADSGNQSALDFYRQLRWQPTQLSVWRRLLRDI
jgi:GNAT superfamily N-acetyltransferase